MSKYINFCIYASSDPMIVDCIYRPKFRIEALPDPGFVKGRGSEAPRFFFFGGGYIYFDLV